MLLAFIGISDLFGSSVNEKTALAYWLSNVPIRLFFLFVMTSYVYLCKEGGVLGPGPLQPVGLGEPLQNSLVFTFGFVEIAMWFWVCDVFIWLDETVYLRLMRLCRRFRVCRI